MTTQFRHGTGTYLAVVSQAGRREIEGAADSLQPDPKLWTSRTRKLAMGVEEDRETPRERYKRKNLNARRRAAKLAMRKLRAERAA